MALRKLSLMSDIEHELWLMLEEMRTEHDIRPSDALAYMSQAWSKTKSDWEREFPENKTE